MAISTQALCADPLGAIIGVQFAATETTEKMVLLLMTHDVAWKVDSLSPFGEHPINGVSTVNRTRAWSRMACSESLIRSLGVPYMANCVTTGGRVASVL